MKPGPKSTARGAARVVVAIRLDPKLRDRARKFAVANGLQISDTYETALSSYLKREGA